MVPKRGALVPNRGEQRNGHLSVIPGEIPDMLRSTPRRYVHK